MRNLLKKATAFFLVLALVIAVFPPISVSAATVSNVGSLWDGFTSGSGTFTVTASSRVFVVGTAAPTGELLQTAQLIQRELRAQFGESYFAEMVWGPESYAKSGDIVLKLDASSGTGTDGYKLNVTATTATVTAADVDGLIYGANNLIKCFRAVGGKSISGFSGYDSPDTKERTVHLDVARKYYTVEWICNFIRQMSWMGYNALELHTSEDGGFRADLWDSNYYQKTDTDGDGYTYSPANDFSWLCGSYIQTWVKDPYRTDPDAGKYLTTAELVQICEVAKEYHIEIIPSFDSPAHMDYITWKFEQNYLNNTSYSFTYNGDPYEASSTKGCINYTGQTVSTLKAAGYKDVNEGTLTISDGPSNWPCYTTIDITDGTMAKAFVFAIYEDMAAFFKEYAGSTKFNIGADEVNMAYYSSRWPRKWSYSAFPGYVNDLNRLLNDKGYTVRMYNDFIGSTTYNQEYDTSEGISSYNSVYDFDDNIEICYWDSDFNPTSGVYDQNIWHVYFFWENNTGTSSNWGDGGRTMYNCIQTNTYYVLRVAADDTDYPGWDARHAENYNWTFYGTNEEDIYNNWYPADISEKGKHSEDAIDVPDDQLGGAYFLIWNDYAALNTESEVWNGATDAKYSNITYYLFDIMASNIMKMWNSDINSTVTYTNFAAVRKTYGWFPGYTSCSAAANLPAPTAPTRAYLADHSALTAALAAVITDQGNYTDESWSAYQAAIAAAKTVNADYGATAAELATALTNLQNAAAALEEKPAETEPTDPTVPTDPETNFTVTYKTTLSDGSVKTVKTQGYYLADAASSFQIYLPPMIGYSFDHAENCTFVPLASGDGSGYLRGPNNGGSVVVWLTNEPDTSYLDTLLAGALTEQGSYTADSWTAYLTALNAAKHVEATTQADIDAAANALLAAQTALVVAVDSTQIIEIEGLAGEDTAGNIIARLGKQVGLRITTSPDVSAITVSGETLTVHTGRIQELTSGTVKIWFVCFPADEAGTFTYTIAAGSAAQEITITVS